MIVLPPMLAGQTASWHALLDLYERHPEGWTLVGGQMVHLHCAERDYSPTDLISRRTALHGGIVTVAAAAVGAMVAVAPLRAQDRAPRRPRPSQPREAHVSDPRRAAREANLGALAAVVASGRIVRFFSPERARSPDLPSTLDLPWGAFLGVQDARGAVRTVSH